MIKLAAAIIGMTFLLAPCARGEDELPDNPGLRLPYSEADGPRIRIEEAMHYRHPRDYSNHKTGEPYRNFRDDCGDDEECVRHFPDHDRVSAAHKSIDYLDVTGGTFTVYAGISGVVYKVGRIASQPWFSSLVIKAKIRGSSYFIEYGHLDPGSIQLTEGQSVTCETPIGQLYVDRNPVWLLDGISVQGYCRPSDSAHPFYGESGNRCYQAHLDYQVREIIGDTAEARDPYKICGVLNEGNLDSCKSYHYPGNRFGIPARPGPNHLWEMNDDGTAIRTAVALPHENRGTAAALPSDR